MTETDELFGDFVYQAQAPSWLRVPVVVVLLLVTLAGASKLTNWDQLSWVQRGIYLCVVLGFPGLISETLLRRVRFYERGIECRTWVGNSRRLEYEQVQACYGENTSKLSIYPREGKVIEIPKSEGDLELIAQIIRERQPREPRGTSTQIDTPAPC